MVTKFNDDRATMLLDEVATNVKYFCEKSALIRMSERDERHRQGTDKEGRKWQRQLSSPSTVTEQLNALAQILYLVRCNLAHGSKIESGDDKEIIEQALKPLCLLVKESMRLTEDTFLSTTHDPLLRGERRRVPDGS